MSAKFVLMSAALLTGGLFQARGDGRPTGLVPATPEELRGIPLASTPFSGAELPAAVDLSSAMPPPLHQGELHSCTAWSVGYAVKSYHEYVEEKRPLRRADGAIDPARVFSPAFIYNQLNNGRNAGVRFIDALNLLRERGAAPWSLMPYDGRDLTAQPSAEARAAALRYRIDYWRQVNVHDPREIKAHLHAGYPVMFGAKMDPAIEKARPGFIWRETKPGPCEFGECGYHAMVLVGYDDARRAFKLINSWGPEWGDGGYGWIDYAHFGRVSTEAYVAKDALNSPPPADGIVTPPRPPPGADLRLTAVQYDAVLPDRPQDGYYLRLDGTLHISPGMGSANQVAIAFWFDAGNGTKGAMVPGVTPAYATVYGQAACGTARYPVPPEGLATTWAAWIPYTALNVPMGAYVQTAQGPVYQPRVTALVAEAVLYVDNFGVATTPLLPFSVSR